MSYIVFPSLTFSPTIPCKSSIPQSISLSAETSTQIKSQRTEQASSIPLLLKSRGSLNHVKVLLSRNEEVQQHLVTQPLIKPVTCVRGKLIYNGVHTDTYEEIAPAGIHTSPPEKLLAGKGSLQSQLTISPHWYTTLTARDFSIAEGFQ